MISNIITLLYGISHGLLLGWPLGYGGDPERGRVVLTNDGGRVNSRKKGGGGEREREGEKKDKGKRDDKGNYESWPLLAGSWMHIVADDCKSPG